MRNVYKLTVVAAFCFCFATLNTTKAQVIGSGDCGASGNNLTWVLTSDSTLTISGSGDMKDYIGTSMVPWYSYRARITKLIIGDSVTSIGRYSFYNCRLRFLSIPNLVTSIGYGAFSECKDLISVSIPNSVITIVERAFYGCDRLPSVTIPNSVTTIGNLAFYYCQSLTSVNIPNSVTTIGESCFSKCIMLTSVNISSSVTAIGDLAFSLCPKLTSINVDINNIRYSSNDGILYTKLQDTLVYYPNGKTGDVIIPNSVTTIGYAAFYYFYDLTSVVIPSSVITIEDAAFSSCTLLTSITIPNSVTTIGVSAFHDCKGLTSASIGSSVSTIDHSAFRNCNNLEYIICKASIPPTVLYGYTFYGIPKNIPVYVPCNSVGNYQGSLNWEDFTNYVGMVLMSEDITVTQENKTLKISWENNSDATEYIVYRDNQILDTVPKNMSTKTVYTDNTVAVGVNYCYKIKAINETCEEGELSEEVCGMVIIPIVSISLSEKNIIIDENQDHALNVIFNPSDATNQNVIWKSENTNVATVNTNGIVIGISSGKTYVIVTSDDGNFQDSCKVTVRSVGINCFTKEEINIRIYPNPTTGKLTINNEQLKIKNVEIFDVVGSKLWVVSGAELHDSQFKIDISHLANGMYFLKIDGKVFKVIKN